MRLVDKIDVLDRRRFLRGWGTTAALLATAPALSSRAYAATTPKAGSAAHATLVKMARDLYPHDRLSDQAYEAAVGAIAEQLAADPAKAMVLEEGVVELDAAAMKLKAKPYTAIADEMDRVAVLKSIEQGAFFAAMRSNMITALYNQPDLWAQFGYEGSSAEEGGYIHRGFDNLDWLPA